MADTYNPVIRAITEMDKPVIGAVNGLAVGAGMGLALACDEIVMARSAFLACAFGRVGLVPDSGVTLSSCSVSVTPAHLSWREPVAESVAKTRLPWD